MIPVRRNSILVTHHYPDLGICYRSRQISLATQPIKSITQISVETRHQYGIFAVLAQTSFRGEISGDQW